MKKLKPILLLVLVFAAGLAVGAVGTRAIVRHVVREAVANPDRVRQMFERRLERKLDLNAGQKEQLEQIYAESQARIREIRQELRPRVQAVIRETNQKVAAILTPEQRKEFEKLRQENAKMLRGEAPRK